MRKLLLAVGIIFLLGSARLAVAASEIVVAIRWLQATGTNHSHLFLYREDGKLLRHLTSDDSGQDRGPVFAPDGETILWKREKGTAAPEF